EGQDRKARLILSKYPPHKEPGCARGSVCGATPPAGCALPPRIRAVTRSPKAQPDKTMEQDQMSTELETAIEAAWHARETVTPGSRDVRGAVDAALRLLDSGEARVAEPDGKGGWQVNQWLKKAVLLSFRLNDNRVMEGGSAGAPTLDKVPSKFDGW